MIKRVWMVVYLLLLIAGVLAIVFIHNSYKQTCVSKDKICVSYSKSWKTNSPQSPYDLILTRTKPFNGIFQMAFKNVNISGSANALAGALNEQLSKQAPAYHLDQTNALVISNKKIVAVELVFDYTPSSAPVSVRQSYIVAPYKGNTYYFISEATTSNFAKFQTELDQLLGRIKIN